MKKVVLISTFSIILYGVTFAGDWANSIGSCYEKGNKTVSAGLSILHFGYFGAFDYAFHDAISGGFATGFNAYRHSKNWRFNYMPFAFRAAFHPFNLTVIADKIRIRHKMDVFVGLSSGGRIGWINYRGDYPDDKPPEPDVGGFFIREYIGMRFFPNDMFFLLVEEGSGLGFINLGCGLKF